MRRSTTLNHLLPIFVWVFFVILSIGWPQR